MGWPAKPLWPNFRSRSHWPKTQALKVARAEAYYATKAARLGLIAGDGIIPVQATFNPPDRRTRDYDNCSSTLKPFFDGIADALGVNDSSFRPQPIIVGDVVKGGRLTVTIGEVA
nr:hypothetical protein [Sphingomonas japonica]